MTKAMVEIEKSAWFSHPMCDKKRQFSVKKSLPFVESIRGEYTHRVRHVTIYTDARAAHAAVSCWCGMSITISNRKKNMLVAEPSQGRPVCATCEGRVARVGIAQPQEINGHTVKYSPRKTS